ncbi:MAG: 4Fe-4S binding protein [Chloroflexi bacterium]|nr:4Fe-4S binding protein [Chloroflexota bacterium]
MIDTRAPSLPAQLVTRSESPRVAVLFSERLTSVFDLTELRDWLQTTLPTVGVGIIASPDKQPEAIAETVAALRAQRVVVALASGEGSIPQIQAQARKAGLDALGIEAFDLSARVAPGDSGPATIARAKLVLAAAVAKARAFPGSRPENVKGSMSVAMSRRALFTLAIREYHSVPAVQVDRCGVDRGCHRCVDVCPQRALRVSDQRIELDKDLCGSCGVCVTACPSEALTFPGYSAGELDAQIATLLDPAIGDLAPRGILFVCRQTAGALDRAVARGFRHPAGWLPVTVPCAGSLSPTLFLRCLALGAAAVGVAGCLDQCGFRQGNDVVQRIAFTQELLHQIGQPRDRVRFCSVGVDDPAVWALPVEASAIPPADLLARDSGPGAAGATALLHLAATASAAAAPAAAAGVVPDVKLAHPQSPYGLVDIDAAGCTACEACTTVCPTGALAGGLEGGNVVISFDAALCVACGQCLPRCPEAERNVLRLTRAVDVRRLSEGRVAIYRDATPHCESCGAAIAPGAMMARIAELLGDDYGPLAATIARYCSDCRGLPTALPTNGAVGR